MSVQFQLLNLVICVEITRQIDMKHFFDNALISYKLYPSSILIRNDFLTVDCRSQYLVLSTQ